jgi:cyclophilin family peptidyl-prolyl cis-trans isomerase
MFLKRLSIAVMCAVVLSAGLTACGKDVDTKENGEKTSFTSSDKTDKNDKDKDKDKDKNSSASNSQNAEIVNFTAPQKGEQIVIMKIKDYGEVKFKLFPDLCPKGVENFVELAKRGYYDELIFHRVINNFMIQGGDPKGNGTGGTSIWGEKFDGGVSPNLCHAAGALAYANSGSTATNGSQFYVVTGTVYSEDDLRSLEMSSGTNMNENARAIYSTVGGTPWLDGGYTVFGQVFDGLDVIFEIQKTATDGNDKPYEAVVIESVKVSEYNGEELKWYISDYN